MNRLHLIVFLGLCIGVAAAAAFGAEPPAPPARYTLDVSRDELVYMAALLRKRPYDEVADLLTSIQRQIDEQAAPKAPAADPPATAAP